MRRDHCAHCRSHFRGRLAVSAGGTRILASRLSATGAADGCYVGVNIGGAWAKIDEGNAVGGTLTANPAGVAGGGQIGCDIQFDQRVFGIRDMFDGTNLRSSTSFSAGSANTRTNWFDTLTARQGFLFQPNVLIYAQGGAAWTNTSVTVFNFAGTQIGQSSTNNNGWTLGGGGEWMFAPHWSGVRRI